MAALQVHWIALAAQFTADQVKALDVPGVCPLCDICPEVRALRTQSLAPCAIAFVRAQSAMGTNLIASARIPCWQRAEYAQRTHAGDVERLDLVGGELSSQCDPVHLQGGHDDRRNRYVDGLVPRLQYRRRLSLDPGGSGPANRRDTVADACGETRLGGERRAQEL